MALTIKSAGLHAHDTPYLLQELPPVTVVETVPVAIEYNNQKRKVYCRGFTLFREMFTNMVGGGGGGGNG
jgi:hypothetical protein